MIYSKICDSNGDCSASPSAEVAAALSEQEISARLFSIQENMKSKRYDKALEEYRTLADAGCAEAEKEYAAILEKGQLVPKSLDLAMKYFYRAALKNDAYSAYRYSRLAQRTNRDISSFWLIYSAVLGCAAAYPDAAEEFSRQGYEEDALYFTRLAASCDDTDSIVSLAKRYYEGIGTEVSYEYAKWYMDKLKFPPIYALRLAYKLKGTTAKEPPEITLKGYDGLLRKLAAKARECSFEGAYFKLSKMLAARGDTDAAATLAELLLDGRGCKQNITEALKLLTKAAAMGSIRASLILGDLYFDERLFSRDTPTAIAHYKRAGELGAYQAYELIGDIYYTGSGLTSDVARAVEFYDLAAAAGSTSAKESSRKIKKERMDLFEMALASKNAEDAFRLYSLSSSLGLAEAKLKLAECFEYGLGTEINKRAAFLLYEKSAKLGNITALTSLGRCYAYGIGTNRDFSLSRKLLCKAEGLGDERASQIITELMERKKRKISSAHLSAGIRLIYQGKIQIAKRHLEASSYLENPKAIYTLGCLYEFGAGVPCDKQRAYAMYERAFSLLFRDPRSVYKLAILRLIKSTK